jgi:hypothetical protein
VELGSSPKTLKICRRNKGSYLEKLKYGPIEIRVSYLEKMLHAVEKFPGPCLALASCFV